MNDIETFIDSIDYFDCERYHARISREACIERQSKTGRQRSVSSTFTQLGCENCEQGREIMSEQGKEMEIKAEKTETLASKVCSHCKEGKPIEEFHINRASKTGYDYFCKACKKIRDKERRARKDAPQETKAVPAVAPPENTIKIDLQEYPAIFDSLKREAKDEFRTIDQQVLYILNRRFSTMDEDTQGPHRVEDYSTRIPKSIIKG